MAENAVTPYDAHFHLGMRVMTLILCFRGWQVCISLNTLKKMNLVQH